MATSYCEIKIHPFPILYHDLKKKPEKKATEHFQGRGKFHGSFYDFGNGKSIKKRILFLLLILTLFIPTYPRVLQHGPALVGSVTSL